MSKNDLIDKLYSGSQSWNEFHKNNSKIKIDLSGEEFISFDFSNYDFENCIFQSCNFDNSDFVKTNLLKCDFEQSKFARCRFHEANLSHANLTRTTFHECSLTNTNLNGSYLNSAYLYQSTIKAGNFVKTNFNFSSLQNLSFITVDLSEAIDLDKVLPQGPSSIGLDTLAASKGRLPIAFLRGCGLNNLQIEISKLFENGMDPEQVNQIAYRICDLYYGNPIQFYSCFISYSSKDEVFAIKLYNDLQDKGVRCWYDKADLKIGDPIRKTIYEQVRIRDKFLVIISENSILSGWVGSEVEKAFSEERSQKVNKLFPIRLDNAVLTAKDDWAETIRLEKYIGDFSKWQDGQIYKQALSKLIEALQEEKKFHSV